MVKISVVVLVLCSLLSRNDAFVSSFPKKSFRLSVLAAKANKNRNKGGQKASSGGGFGTVTQAPSDKVRSFSGFSGSGTKQLRKAANTFDSLVKKHGKESVSDVYVKSPLNDPDLFWFVGKVARCIDENELHGDSIPTEDEAVLSQKRLILEYAKRELRPQNLGGPFSEGLELWLAPGDSEMDCVQNKVSLTKVEGSTASLSDGFNVVDVGYNPEIYVGDEATKGGLRIVRDSEGHPIKEAFEVNHSA